MNLLLELPCPASHLYFPGIIITPQLTSHMSCTSCHTCQDVTMSQVHHQGVEVTGPPPLGSERHHRDVSLPLL